LLGMACLVAADSVEGFFIQAHFAATEDGLPLLIETDAVGDEHAVLAAVEVAVAWIQRFVGGGERWRVFVDVAGADVLVDRVALVDHPTECAGAEGQLMADACGVEQPGHGRLHFVVAAGVVGAAVVVDVVVSFGAEGVRHA